MRLTFPRFRLPRLARAWGRRPPAARGSRRRRARAALLWAPAGWVITVVCAWALAETVAPVVIDPEYHYKVETARADAEAKPGRPLAMVLGSSRMLWAFHPELIPGAPTNWTNASHLGAGPVLSRILLRRLLRDGIHPEVLVLEVMPPYFVREDPQWLGRTLTAEELFIARRYWEFGELEFWYVVERLIRIGPLARVFDPYREIPAPLKRDGHKLLLPSITAEERAERTESQRQQHAAQAAALEVSPGADRAFRDTLREAADAGVKVVILRAPEGSVFRSWYDPDRLARFDEYVRGVAAEFRVPVVDARNWLADDDFYDYHHTIRPGAVKFTRRLVREVALALAQRR